MPEKLLAKFARCRHEGLPDAELVSRYVAGRDDGAFAELVRRHGPMVLGVCRRVVRNAADADDVFQATFLVLARKAGAVRPAAAVGPWLHGVALRTAKEAVRRAARRRAKEGRVPPREAEAGDDAADLRPVLDAELARLPGPAAQVLILCDLEGRTRPEVAALLGVPEGTVASRLARARGVLATRLTRRGIALPAGAVAAVLSADTATAVPPELLARTAAGSDSPAVQSLANAILRGSAVRLAAGVAVVAAAVVAAWAACDTPAQPPRPEPVRAAVAPVPVQPSPPTPDPAAAARDRLAGRWRVDAGTRNGQPLDDWETGGFAFDFDPTGVLRVHRGQVRGRREFTWAVESAAPTVLALASPDGPVGVSFALSGDALTLAWDEPEAGRTGPRGRGAGPTAWRLTLSKVTAGPPAELAVAPSPQNVVGSRLAGTWETDPELSRRLGHDRSGRVTLSFEADPAVAREVPAAYRELFTGRRVYLAGRVTVAADGGDPATHRFLLTEHHGTAVLVVFVPRGGDAWACEEAVTVALAPAADAANDLLVVSAVAPSAHLLTGCYRRIPGGGSG